MVDLTKFPNPYDFANPVTDEELFVGRKNELEEIEYYLNHAKTASRPINIAIIGPRASGKTSFLNITEIKAKRKGFLTVRIDLDEGDAKTQLAFFYKLFDGLLTVVCEFGAFGGIEGKTYETYLDIVNTYVIPEDKTFCPFLFPLQYAKAMGSGNFNALLSDHNYKKDLIKIYDEVKKPIVLLFDEGDVLVSNKVILEKLRNIFMNISGYMLVIAGTPNFFPIISEVFSPISRQFKKVNIGSFKNIRETEECIKKPLEKIGIKPEDIFDTKTYYTDIEEIHNLSGGRPYEIQLVCHMLFRRIQSKQAREMKLNLSVLEDVRRELESLQNIITRPILTKIRSVKKELLSALNLLCACDGHATFDQLWSIEYIFNDEEKWTKEGLNKKLQYFVDEGIIKVEGDIIRFAGDEFDKIYIKYFAREQGVSLSFPDFPLELFWEVRLRNFLGKIGITSIELFLITDYLNFDFNELCIKFANQNLEEDIFEENPPGILEKLYFLMLDYRFEKTIPVLQMRINLLGITGLYLYYVPNPTNLDDLDTFLQNVEPLKKRADEVGGKLLVEKKEIPVVSVEVLTKKVEFTKNEKFKNLLSDLHALKMVRQYLENANIEEALFHGDLAFRYSSEPEPGLSNNLGYLYMCVGDFDKARSLFEKAISDYKESSEAALPNYNLGVLEAKCGNFDIALEKINFCISQLEATSEREVECECLIVPKLIGGKLEYEEIKKPNLLETAIKARDVLESFLNIIHS